MLAESSNYSKCIVYWLDTWKFLSSNSEFLDFMNDKKMSIQPTEMSNIESKVILNEYLI